MARKKTDTKRPIESYEHRDKERLNNPPVGLVTPDTDPDAGAKKTYAYDPHLDPQLVWAGKAEHTAFEVPTVSLHSGSGAQVSLTLALSQWERVARSAG